jgi:hemoglobin/transferrin/lactoferrin receptor protein
VYQLDLEELSTGGLSRTFPEALREVPGILVQKTSGQQASPFLRGMTGFRNVLLIDGIRLNNATFREGPNQYWGTVDPCSVRSLEIEKGPGSVLWGSDAVGGTVQALTDRWEEYGVGLHWSTHLTSRLATADDSAILRTELGGSVDERFSFLGGITLKGFDDLEAGGDTGTLPKTGYAEWDADVKLEYLLDPDTRLVLAHQHVDQDDAWRAHKTVYGISFEDSTIGNELQRVLDQNRDLLYVQLHQERPEGLVNSVHASLSWQRQEEEQHRIRSNLRQDRQGVTVNTLGAWLQLGSSTPLGELTYGVDAYRDLVDSYRDDLNADGSLRRERIQGPVGDDSTYDLVGVYLQDDISFFERADLILGLRFTHADAHAREVEDPEIGEPVSLREDWQNLIGSGRLTIALDEARQWRVFGGIGQSFRAPNLSDLTRLDTARSSEIEVPSPGLDPEKFLTYEVGLKTRLNWWDLQLSYFYTDIQSLITRTPTGEILDDSNVVVKRNTDGGFLEGIEATTALHLFEQLTVRGTFAWLDGEVEEYPTSDPTPVTEPVSRLLPTTGLVGIRWDHPDGTLWAEGTLLLADEQDDLSTRDALDTQRIPPGGTPGYQLLSFRGGWQFTEALGASLTLENVLDQDYRIHGSGQNEAGFNVVLGLDLRLGGSNEER